MTGPTSSASTRTPMGVGPGGIEGYWKEIYSYDSLMGGCIWEMVDHAVLHEDGSYTYGGDHGEWEHDGNFCVDGLFYPDRTPSTGAKLARFTYRPIRVSKVGENRFEIFNTTAFTNGSRYELKFEWSDGRCAVVIPDTEPLSKSIVTVEPSDIEDESPEVNGDLTANRMSWVTVTTTDRRSGREVSKEQILLGAMESLAEADPELLEKEEKLPDEVSLTADGFALKTDGFTLTSGTPYTILYRVSTDNDKTLTGDKPMEQFEGAKEEMLHADYKDGAVTVATKITCKKSVFTCTDTYEKTAGGILVTSRIHCEKGQGTFAEIREDLPPG